MTVRHAFARRCGAPSRDGEARPRAPDPIRAPDLIRGLDPQRAAPRIEGQDQVRSAVASGAVRGARTGTPPHGATRLSLSRATKAAAVHPAAR